jgi:hypothetical protein
MIVLDTANSAAQYNLMPPPGPVREYSNARSRQQRGRTKYGGEWKNGEQGLPTTFSHPPKLAFAGILAFRQVKVRPSRRNNSACLSPGSRQSSINEPLRKPDPRSASLFWPESQIS